MDRLVLIVGAVAIAALVAAVFGRRRPAPPTAPTHHVPRQLDRQDFRRPDAPWLVAVFTSATCRTCAGVWERVGHLESAHVATQEVEYGAERRLHERYDIDGVPLTVIADHAGVAQRWFLGPATATDLWAAMAEIRQPGTVAPSCDVGTDPGELGLGDIDEGNGILDGDA